MKEHITFLFYIIFFVFSVIGHGFIFSRLINKELLNYNLGYQGIIGFFSISLISITTSYFIPHNFVHNSLLHLVGIIFFLIQYKSNEKVFVDTNKFLILLPIFLIGIYIFKNHDDFSYYHLTYSLNLSENRFIIGTGIFSHGFRTFSSLFYFHSILYMPFIKFYLFHMGPFLIVIFFNYILISKLFSKYKKSEFDIIYFFSLLSLVFINIVFYRIGEHGTDRSAQVLLLLIIITFFELIFKQIKYEKQNKIISFFIIIVFLASIMKALYYLYLILIPYIFFKKKIVKKFLIKKNYRLIFLLIFCLSLNLTTNYFGTGCFLYPAKTTCIGKQDWSLPKEQVSRMSIHYEWWAKAGGGPGYKSEIPKEEYVKNFVWLENWINRHFFNKVSDTLFGIISISIISLLFFRNSKKKNIKKNYLFIYLISFLLLIEWFIKHPAMRYGGYVLIAIPFFIFTSSVIEKYNNTKKKILYLTTILVIISLFGYNFRNLIRLNKEINFYKYDIIKSPYFFVGEVQSIKVLQKEDFIVYSTKDGKSCWASKTPCTYMRSLKTKKFGWLNVVYKDDG